MPTTNGVAHFDVAGPALAPLRGFYAALFGWTVHEKGPGYALVETPDGTPNGALVEAEDASLTVGVVVADLAAALERCAEQGGTVVMPATDNGWVVKAQVADPAGNRLTLIEAGH